MDATDQWEIKETLECLHLVLRDLKENKDPEEQLDPTLIKNVRFLKLFNDFAIAKMFLDVEDQ